MPRKSLLLALALCFALFPAPASAVWIFSGFGVGIVVPRSGPLEKYWRKGPSLSIHRDVATFGRVGLVGSVRYSWFGYPTGEGYSTHAFNALVSTQWRPRPNRSIELSLRTGLAGLWTSDGRSSANAADGPGFILRSEKYRGWGPSLGGGIGYFVREDSGETFILRAVYDRAWASDGSADVLAVFLEFRPGEQSDED